MHRHDLDAPPARRVALRRARSNRASRVAGSSTSPRASLRASSAKIAPRPEILRPVETRRAVEQPPRVLDSARERRRAAARTPPRARGAGAQRAGAAGGA
jgi:hypothetical protein